MLSGYPNMTVKFPLSPFFPLLCAFCNTAFHPSGDILPVQYRPITYVSKDCHNRYVTSFLNCQFEDEPEAGFPWELSLFSPAKGPRIGLSLLSQSKGKCLVCSDVGHLMVTGQVFWSQYEEKHSIDFSNSHYVTTEMDKGLLHRLHRPFVKNGITRSEMLRIFGVPHSSDYFEGDKGL